MYDITRPRIILQNVEPGQTLTREVFIKNNYQENFSIASVACLNGTMKIASQEKQGSSIKLMVEIAIPPQTSTARRYITDKLDIKMSDGELLTINCSAMPWTSSSTRWMCRVTNSSWPGRPGSCAAAGRQTRMILVFLT